MTSSVTRDGREGRRRTPPFGVRKLRCAAVASRAADVRLSRRYSVVTRPQDKLRPNITRNIILNITLNTTLNITLNLTRQSR